MDEKVLEKHVNKTVLSVKDCKRGQCFVSLDKKSFYRVILLDHPSGIPVYYLRLAKLQEFRHPHIAPAKLSILAHKDETYLLIEEPYKERSIHPMFVMDPVLLLHRILSAIAFYHKHGIVHGRVYPENINFSPPYRLHDAMLAQTLIDESCIKDSYDIEEWHAKHRSMDMYDAPELHVGYVEKTTFQDMWSFGILIYHLLFKKLPECPDYEPSFWDPLGIFHSEPTSYENMFRFFGQPSEEWWMTYATHDLKRPTHHKDTCLFTKLFTLNRHENSDDFPFENTYEIPQSIYNSFLDLLKQCLMIDPHDRRSAST
jgi:serine/threonine protein kinase